MSFSRALVKGIKQSRLFASVAASKEAAPLLKPFGKPEVSRLENGISVASLETLHPVSRLSVALRVGPRDETHDIAGVSHLLRLMCDEATEKTSVVDLRRSLNQLAISLTCTTTPELTVYNIEGPRDDVYNMQHILTEVISCPSLKSWAVRDKQKHLSLDRALLSLNPEETLMDMLLSTAYRGRMGNSLCTPEFMIGNVTSDMLSDFRSSLFTTGRTAVVASGMDHNSAQAFARTLTLLVGDGPVSKAPAFSAGDSRLGSLLPKVLTGFCVEGASVAQEEGEALRVLSHLLGSSSCVKYSSGSGPLTKAVGSAVKGHFKVHSFSTSFTDTGIFGVLLSADKNEAGTAVKAAYSVFRSIASGAGLTEEDVQRGKNKRKMELQSLVENRDHFVTHSASKLLSKAGDIQPIEAVVKKIDSISLADIQKIAKRLTSTKLSMASIGNLDGVPYHDELLN